MIVRNTFSFLIFLALLLSAQLAFSQKKIFENSSLSFGFNRGLLLPEYQFINYLSREGTTSFDLSFIKETTGKNEWEVAYNYPSFGLSFFYSSLGNDEIFGKEYAVVPFFRITLLQKKKFSLYNQTGLGFGYVTEKFDLEKNFKNVAVGSHANFHFNVRVGAKFPLYKKLAVNTGLALDHFSNANTSEPNLGLNYLSYFFSLQLYMNQKEKINTELSPHVPKTENELVYNIGGKHSRALSSKYYFTSSLSFEKRKSFFRALHLGVGADLFYDTSVEDQLTKDEKNFKSHYEFQTGIHISQSIVYDRFSLTLQEGIYLGLRERVNGYVMYNRGIFKYWLSDCFSIRLSMKSHLHILDYPEIGFGIKL